MKLNWKINRDSFYKPLYEKYGEEFIIEAGFVYDSAKEDYQISTDLKCTPISFLLDNLSIAKNPCILLTTGSFNPIHNGHLEMMLKAKQACETNGFDVIGGYIAPDHDEYVNTKANYLNINERIKYISKQIKDIDWLAVDPWNGIFMNNAVNFTDIYIHLQRYLKRYLDIDIPIFFVCGGDNAKFSLTFLEKGNCVIVDRPNYRERTNKYKQYLNERILYIFNDNPNSSTEVRKIVEKEKESEKKLLLRINSFDEREVKILKLLKEHFKKIEISFVEDQEKSIQLTNNFISLDSCITLKNNLEISRQYDFFGIKNLGFTNRPGSKTLFEQVKNINIKSCILFDDDIHTGNTINFAKKYLEKNGIKVNGLMTLNKSTSNEEILDLRDFYYGTLNCGLVLKTGKVTKRYPYIYPFVCPFVRASIKNPLFFSKEVWKINMNYWEGLDNEKYLFCKEQFNLLNSI